MILGCGKETSSAKSSKFIAAPIHAVNYTAEEFTYVVTDPADAENSGGGETITAFAAGGTMCCFSLPAVWKPGLKVEVAETVYSPRRADGTLPSVEKKHLLDVPSYQNGQVGALWIVRAPGGTMSVVSSGLQPDHPEWPGKIKGWPVPSDEYQQKILERAIAEEQSTVDLFVRVIEELRTKPERIASESWASEMNTNPVQLTQFNGSSDPAFVEMLIKQFETELALTRLDLEQKMAARR